MRYIVQGSITPLTTTVTAVVDSVDKWGPATGRCPATLPPARAFFSQARTITFTEINPIEQWTDTDAKLLPNSARYPTRNSMAFVTSAQLINWDETITSDKWAPSLGEVRRPPRLTRDGSVFQTQVAPSEIVTSDKWTSPAAKTPWSTRLFRPDEFATGRTAFAETTTPDKWLGSSAIRTPWSTRLFRHDEFVLGRTAFTETTTPDKWLGSPITKTPWINRLFRPDEFILGRTAFTETTTPDKWIGSQGRMIDTRRTVFRDGFAYQLPIIVAEGPVTLDKWRPPDAEVRRVQPRPFFANARTITFKELFPLDWVSIDGVRKPPTLARFRDLYAPSNYPVTPFVETLTLDKWRGADPKVPLQRKDVFYDQYRTLGFIEEFIPEVTLDKWRGNDMLERIRKVVYFNQARTIGFVEEFAPEGPITLDKWMPSTGEVRRRVPRPRGTSPLTEFSTPTVTPETITLDKWMMSRGTIIRAKSYPFFSNARTITYADVSQPSGTGGFDQWSTPMFRVPTKGPWISRYKSVQFGFEVSEVEVTLDKWRGQDPKLILSKKDVFYDQYRTLGFIEEFTPDVTIDKWRGNDIVERLRRVVYFNQARTIGFVEEFAPEGPITLDKWISSQGEVRRNVPKPRGKADLTEFSTPIVVQENVTLDKWMTGWGTLLRKKVYPFFSQARTITYTDVTPPSGTGGFDQWSTPMYRVPTIIPWISRYRSLQFAADIPEGAITVDKWLSDFKLMRAARQPLSNLNIIIPFFGGSQEVSTIDKWLGSTGRVIIPLRASYQREWANYGLPTTFAETTALDKWLGSGSLMRGPRYPLFDRNIIIPFFGGSQETITFDKWNGSLGQVILPRRPSYQREWVQYGKPTTFAETISLDKWIGSPGQIIIPIKRSVSAELASYGVPAEFIAIFDLDKWEGSQGRIIRPTWRSLSKELSTLPQNILFAESATLDKWIGSQGRMIDTRRVVRRDPVYHLQIQIEAVTFDKWAGSQGRIIIPTRRSESRELLTAGKPTQFNEVISIDKWEAVWNHMVIRSARPPLIVDLYGHTLIPRANAATGRLEIYYIMLDNRIYLVQRRPGAKDPERLFEATDAGIESRTYRVTPPQE